MSQKLVMAITSVLLVLVLTSISQVFSESLSAQLYSLEFNTPSELGLDIVFIPEDYAQDEMDEFSETVETYYHSLLSIDPFSEFKDRINVWRIDTTVDFGSNRSPTMERLITVDVGKVKQFVESVMDLDLDGDPPDDLVIVLVDDVTYGGSGYPNIAVAYTGRWGRNVMTHELGHSFGHLGDEYVLHDEDYPAGKTIPYPNIDWDGGKWKDVPGTGAFLGAWYRNLVRPTYDSCIMLRPEYLGFCPVCKRALASLLEYYSPPIILGVSVGIPGIEVIVDGTSYTAYDGYLNVIVGKGYHTIELDDVHQISSSVRYSFEGWEDGLTSTNRTMYLTSDTTIRVSYQLQYHLTLITDHSSAKGSGWYDAGSTANFSLESESVPIEGVLGLLGAKYVFKGWTGDYVGKSLAGSLVMNIAHTIVAEWDTDYSTLHLYGGVAIAVVIVGLIYVGRRRLKQAKPREA